MSVAGDLLKQARFLSKKEPKRPSQASLRRAISASYYALFHFVGDESAKLFVGTGPQRKSARNLARRAIVHSKLKAVCLEFLRPNPKAVVIKEFWESAENHDPLGIVGDPDFAILGKNLCDLQAKRHEADYNFARNLSRQDAFDACDQAEAAMEAWKHLKQDKPEALRLFAMAILLWPGLSGRH